MALLPHALPRLRTVDDLRSSAGRLEALLNQGLPEGIPGDSMAGSIGAGSTSAGIGAPRYAALVCHPHPLGGGTMHNKVVYHTMKVLQRYGLPVLRFNFRGTGLSEGTHDDGHGEQDDVRAALDWLDKEFRLPVLFAGFSFGSAVGLKVCCGDARVAGLVALGLPTSAEGREYHYRFFPRCTQPKLFISGGRDQYGPQQEVEAVVSTAPPPCRLVFVPEADHFFLGRLDAMQAALRSWLEDTFLFGSVQSQPERAHLNPKGLHSPK